MVGLGGEMENEKNDVHLSIRISTQLEAECRQLAKLEGQSLAEWVRRAMIVKARGDKSVDANKITQLLDDPDALDLIIDALGERLQPMIEASVRQALDKIEGEERT